MTRRLPLLALCLAVLGVAACGPADEATDARPGVVLAPAETLLDRLDGWRVVDYPATGLPADVAVTETLDETSGVLRVRPDEWDVADVLPAPFRHSLALADDAKVFRARPRVPFRPSAGAELRHDGRTLRPWVLPDAEQLWRDDEAELVFWWDTVNGTLHALGRWPPGHATLSQGTEVDADPDGDGVPTPAGLLHRLAVDTTQRDGMLVPAPSELSVDLADLDAARLHVVVAVAKRVYRRDDAGRVLQQSWDELPVAFSVEATTDGHRRELWSRTVAAEDGFVEDVVDLSGLPEGAVTLHLLTGRAEDTDGGWAFGFWADLGLDGRRTPPPAVGRPHVVVLDVSGLRADRVGLLGAARDTTPHLDDWATAHATVYPDVTAAAGGTVPSLASLLTGLSVEQHGVTGPRQALGDGAPTLATRLRRAGYRTYASVEGGGTGAAFGFDQGFDMYDERPFQAMAWREALDWLEREDDRPGFLFLQTWAVHAPWPADPRFDDPRRPYDGPLAGRAVTWEGVLEPWESGRLALDERDRAYATSLHDAAVARFDEDLAEFLERLDVVAPAERRVLVLTSDQGVSLFEHGRAGGGRSLFAERLAVPLVVQTPDRATGRLEPVPASGVDLVPTVLQAVGVDVPAGLAGRPLRELAADPRPRVAHHGDGGRSVQFDGWKLVVGPVEGPDGALDELQLYDLHADPGELDDIAEAGPEWVRRLQGMLEEARRELRPPGPGTSQPVVDARAVDALRRLGYPGGR